MASPAYCAHCFETLSADLEDRSPIPYQELLRLWAQWEELQKGSAAPAQDAASGSSQDKLENEAASGKEGTVDVEGPQPHRVFSPSSGLQLPSISRLQASSPASASSSTSTSSSVSTSPSRATLHANSKSSSNSSFFSSPFARSKQPSPATSANPLSSLASPEGAYPLFVTWNTLSRHDPSHKSLRGCIGTFEAQDLGKGLGSYALTAALNDTRFPPVALSELDSLSCSVTLLTNFTPCADGPLDWDLGVHGIRINFSHRGKRYGATYLPDVAVEQGWSKEETIVSLMRKAGWSGRSRDWRDVWNKEGGTAVRYEGSKASLAWAEWEAWRSWVERRPVRGR